MRRSTRFDGSQASTRDYRGKPVVVNFFSSTCVPCQTEMPALEQVHRKAGDKVAFLGLDVQDTVASGKAFVESVGVTWDMGRDPDASILQGLGGTALPTTVLLDANGKIVYQHLGTLDVDELDKQLREHGFIDVIDAPLALAFTTGMVATVNPCGFAMLPAYLSFFIGIEDRDDDDPRASCGGRWWSASRSRSASPRRSRWSGCVVSRVTRSVYDVAPWISLVIGGRARRPRHRAARRVRAQPALAAARPRRSHARARLDGAVRCVVRGRVDRLRAPALPRGDQRRVRPRPRVGRGVLRRVRARLRRRARVAHRGAGDGPPIDRAQPATVLPYVSRIAGGLLVLTGAYVAWYGWNEIRERRRRRRP